MDSTPSPFQSQLDSPPPISIHPSPLTKLPIKRKSPHDPTTTPTPSSPTPPPPPPFKFHRIWTEPDEIRFLQCLLHCITQLGLSFPKDQQIFYSKFSFQTTAHPYTKSQLSDKLRRLRKKFRATSSKLARGVEVANLSSHDQTLFELSKKIWEPEIRSNCVGKVSNNNNDDNWKIENSYNNNECSFVGAEVCVSENVLLSCNGNVNETSHGLNEPMVDDVNSGSDNGDGNEDKKMNEVKVDYDFGVRERVMWDQGSCGFAAKLVIDVFDESLEKVRKEFVGKGLFGRDDGLSCAGLLKEGLKLDFEKRWREQQVAEMDVLARRWRLVLEDSLHCN